MHNANFFMNRFFLFVKSKTLYLGICRYILGLMLIPYGVSKILRVQFIVLPTYLWQRPLEKLSGYDLTWSFLGYSPWFQTLLGFLELIPALLLLFKRTTLIGAILLLPMTLNVCLINQAYNLWAETKLISAVLLALNFIILLLERKKLKSLLQIILYKGQKFRFAGWEALVNCVLAISAFYLIGGNEIIDYLHQKNELTGDWYHNHPYEWVLQSESINDSAVHSIPKKYYFMVYGHFWEVYDTGANRHNLSYTLNEGQHSLQLRDNHDSITKTFNYHLAGDSTLVLKRTLDSVNQLTLTQVFKRRIINAQK